MTSTSLFLQGLTLLFIYLKLTGVIAWHWFWVVSPVVIPVILVVTVLTAVALYMLIKNLTR